MRDAAPRAGLGAVAGIEPKIHWMKSKPSKWSRLSKPPEPRKPSEIDHVLQHKPGYLIRRLQQMAVSIFLEETAKFEITPVQYAALAAVSAYPGIDQLRLANAIGFDRTTISGVIDRMEAKALLHSAFVVDGPSGPRSCICRQRATACLRTLKSCDRARSAPYSEAVDAAATERVPAKPRDAGFIPQRDKSCPDRSCAYCTA